MKSTMKNNFKWALRRICSKILSDKNFIKIQYRIKTGKELDLNNPKTFREKIQWLKLYDRNPIYTLFVDKVACKDYLKEKVGEKYIIKTLGVYDKFDDIDFDRLPDKFVIKCTHDSGSVIICNNKDEFMKHLNEHKQKIESFKKYNFYYSGREYHYKDVPKKIIVEEFLENEDKTNFLEYKLWTFYGETKLIDVVEKNNESKYGVVSNYYDEKWNALDLKFLFPKKKSEFEKPKQYNQLIKIAKQISKDYPVMRVDFYIVNDEIKIGELTIYHASGYAPMYPEHWDLDIGEYINLEKIKQRNEVSDFNEKAK